MNQLINTNSQLLCKRTFAAGASSQCYWDELILSKCELMLLKYQINPNTNKNGILLSAKWLERVLKYSYLDSIILKNLFMFVSFLTILCWSDIILALAQTLLAFAHTLIALAHTLIALTHLNSTEKLHRLL